VLPAAEPRGWPDPAQLPQQELRGHGAHPRAEGETGMWVRCFIYITWSCSTPPCSMCWINEEGCIYTVTFGVTEWTCFERSDSRKGESHSLGKTTAGFYSWSREIGGLERGSRRQFHTLENRSGTKGSPVWCSDAYSTVVVLFICVCWMKRHRNQVQTSLSCLDIVQNATDGLLKRKKAHGLLFNVYLRSVHTNIYVSVLAWRKK